MLPKEFTDRLIKQFGSSAANEILRVYSKPRLVSFRFNLGKISEVEGLTKVRALGIKIDRALGVAGGFLVRNKSADEMLNSELGFRGEIYLQGLAAMVPVQILAAMVPDKLVDRIEAVTPVRILDLCAAPGGKTSQIRSLLGRGVEIVACESDEVRFEKLKNTMRVQGCEDIKLMLVDSARLGEEYQYYFDFILADVPCSAEGKISLKDPRSYGFLSEKNIIACAKAQRRLLRAAVSYLRPGGRIIYSTCTLSPVENEEMVKWLLGEFSSLTGEEIKLAFGQTRSHGKLGLTILPTTDREGFFVASVKKII